MITNYKLQAVYVILVIIVVCSVLSVRYCLYSNQVSVTIKDAEFNLLLISELPQTKGRTTENVEWPVRDSEADICPFTRRQGFEELPPLPTVRPDQHRIRIETPWGAPIVWSDTADNVRARQQRRIFRVGLNILAIGKYIVFLQPLLKSADDFFMTGHNVTYFVFTDDTGQASRLIKTSRRVVFISEKNQGWPNNTIAKFRCISKHREVYKNIDFIFQSDVDMLFVSEVNSEALDLRVGTLHPWYHDMPRNTFTYDTNPLSLAYVNRSEGEYYFAGGVFCGCRDEMITMSETLEKNILRDLKELNYTALWHDESHLNRYFIDNPPTKVLSPEYCHAGGHNKDVKKRLLIVQKNEKSLRSN